MPKGFLWSGARCGLKNRRNDVGLLVSEAPAHAAALCTTNLVHAACVDVTREVLAQGKVRAVVVNSGNANCCTGAQGERDARRMADLAAEAIGGEPGSVAVAQTGVIGQLIDMAKVEKGVRLAAGALGADPKPFQEAILTTDLVEKSATVEVDGGVIHGVAKGSGMIAPNMATMLAFLATDLDIEGIDLQSALRDAADKSFHNLTVDSDTSTNDMVLALANGASGVRPGAERFQAALEEVCVSLARQIARDGEGATKLIEVIVTGPGDPRRIARTIGDSPLVKTAMFGCDPNWGRIMAAAGRAGVPFDPAQATLVVEASGEDHLLFEGGAPAAFDPKRVSTALKSDHVVLRLDLGPGETATVYTCDFGYGYVRINAEYHT